MKKRTCAAIVTALLLPIAPACLEAVPKTDCIPECMDQVVEVIDGNTIKLKRGLIAQVSGASTLPVDTDRGRANYLCLKSRLLGEWVYAIGQDRNTGDTPIIKIMNKRIRC
jgi:hypothetical protein